MTASEQSDMLAGLIGTPTSHSVVVVERGPVSFFADAVVDDNPVYKDPAAAKDEGFENIPVPPTYPFVMDHWGAFTEFQSGETFAGIGPALGALMSKGGLILHGEQEFTYHRPVVVGDVLVGKGSIVDAYQREGKGRTMTFVVVETNWTYERTGDPVVTTRFNVIHRA